MAAGGAQKNGFRGSQKNPRLLFRLGGLHLPLERPEGERSDAERMQHLARFPMPHSSRGAQMGETAPQL